MYVNMREMLLLYIFMMCTTYCSCENLRTCSFTKLSHHRDQTAEMNIIWKTETTSDIECSMKCFENQQCRSFLFKNLTKLCQLHSEVYMATGQLTSTDDAVYFKKVMPQPTSCVDIKYINPAFADGHYWIYPRSLSVKTKVKIFCHNMAKVPVEYITLLHENYAKYHDMSNHDIYDQCQPLNDKPIKTATFSKIRVSLSDWTVTTTDYTFAVLIGEGIFAGYGHARDCSGPIIREDCTRYGDAKINTKGTGFIVDPNVQWYFGGWRAGVVDFYISDDNTEVSFKCAGYCAKCYPSPRMILQYDEKLSPLEDVSDVISIE